MRRRRLDRCLLRAEVALDAGFPQDAREAVEEARRLGATAIETEEIERRIAAAPVAKRSPMRRALAVAATLAAMAAGAGAVSVMLSNRTAAPAVAPPAVTPAVPAPVAQPAPRDRVAVERLEVAAATVNPPASRPTPPPAGGTPEQVEPSEPASPPAPTPEAQPDAPAPSPPAVSPASATPPPTRAGDPIGVPLAPVVQAAAPVGERVPPPVVAAVETVNRAPVGTSGAAAPPVVDEAIRVRDTLSRYESAYTSLDAAAASAVWPTVDRGALARAFEGLAAQRLSLGECDVTVTGATAKAQCSGSATWTPRVGGGDRTEPRRWSFDLRKVDDGWQIARAITR